MVRHSLFLVAKVEVFPEETISYSFKEKIRSLDLLIAGHFKNERKSVILQQNLKTDLIWKSDN